MAKKKQALENFLRAEEISLTAAQLLVIFCESHRKKVFLEQSFSIASNQLQGSSRAAGGVILAGGTGLQPQAVTPVERQNVVLEGSTW